MLRTLAQKNAKEYISHFKGVVKMKVKKEFDLKMIIKEAIKKRAEEEMKRRQEERKISNFKESRELKRMRHEEKLTW